MVASVLKLIYWQIFEIVFLIEAAKNDFCWLQILAQTRIKEIKAGDYWNPMKNLNLQLLVAGFWLVKTGLTKRVLLVWIGH